MTEQAAPCLCRDIKMMMMRVVLVRRFLFDLNVIVLLSLLFTRNHTSIAEFSTTQLTFQRSDIFYHHTKRRIMIIVQNDTIIFV